MSERYGIWLSWNNRQEEIELPVLPAEIGESIAGDGAEHDVAGLGKINVIKHRGLAEYTIESLFPAQRYSFVTARELKPPIDYVNMIKKWMETLRPIRFVFTGGNAYVDAKGRLVSEINMPASIEEFEWKEIAGSPGDIRYKLRLKEYRFYEAKRLYAAVSPDGRTAVLTGGAAKRPDDRVRPSTYTLAPGDNLWKVAQKVLGDGSRWREIQRLNGIPDAMLRRLPVGMTLKLPPAEGGRPGA